MPEGCYNMHNLICKLTLLRFRLEKYSESGHYLENCFIPAFTIKNNFGMKIIEKKNKYKIKHIPPFSSVTERSEIHYKM